MVSHGIWPRNQDGVEPCRVVEAPVVAEEASWDGEFSSDSRYKGWAHRWAIYAANAARIERIRPGTWITSTPCQQPWYLAYELVTLGRLSDGRVLCD